MSAATSTNGVIALATLWASRPRPNTDPIAEAEQTAAWYREKGRVHELLAEQAPLLAERIAEQEHAAAAYEHARRLLIAVEASRPVPLPVEVTA
jgi:hypothetical protein